MARLELCLLGTPSLSLEGDTVRLDRRKAEALVAYLVLEPGSHQRSDLALLLWPELSASRARSALRRTLRTLTASLGREWFAIERDRLAVRRGVSLWCDAIAFERLTDGTDIGLLTEAVALYQRDFLFELTLRDASGFDDWQRHHAERLRARFGSTLRSLVSFHSAQGDDEQAMVFAERWMRLDPLDEQAHEAAMKIFLKTGRRSAAVRLYDSFASRLEMDLGIDPPRSMIELRQSHSEPERLATDSRTPSLGFASQRGIKQELDSLAAPWREACQSRSLARIDITLDTVYASADRSGRYREGITLLDEAFSATDHGPLLGRLLARQAVLHSCIGEITKARALLGTSLALAESAHDQNEIAFCENRLGCVLFAEGHYAVARKRLRSSARKYRHAENDSGLAWTLNVLGHLSIGTRHARGILTECLDRSRQSNDDVRLASARNSLGKEAYARKELASAQRHLLKSLELRRALGHRIGVADSLNNLGNTLVGLGEYSQALQAFDEAFDIACRIQARPLLAEILVGFAWVRSAGGELERAAHLAAAALYLPGGWQDAKDRASKSLGLVSRELAPDKIKNAVATGKSFHLSAAVSSTSV